jgi:plastocyanin
LKNAIIAIGLVIVLAGLGFFLLRSSGSNNANKDSANQNTTNNSTSSSTAEPNTITLENGEFTPAVLTVKSGQTITLTNKSDGVIQFNSDPHPAHTANNELNIGSVAAGATTTFTVSKTGTWGYHDHLDSGKKGKIVVE